MTVRPGGHVFEPGWRVRKGKDGRKFALCSVEIDGQECGLTRRAGPHQPVDPRSKQPVVDSWSHGDHSHFSVLTPRPYVEPREVKMLRLAAEAVLELPGIGWTLRQRAQEVRRACDLPVDEAPAPVTPVGAEPSRTTLGSQRSAHRWVRKVIKGVYWPIAAAALDQGFTATQRGNGHVRFERGVQAFSLSTTVAEGRGRGFENAKAAARRAGVEV